MTLIDDECKEKGPQRRTLFTIGSLRFDMNHGVLGILSTILVSYSLFLIHIGGVISTSLPFWLSFSIVISTTALASGSYSLLPQVPISSKICWFIVPPHREAFRRTISIIGYLNLRLIHQFGWMDFSKIMAWKDNEEQQLLSQLFIGRLFFSLILVRYNSVYFLPFDANFKNGNTWIFIIPMCIAVNIDTYFQFPSFDNSFEWMEKLEAWERVDNWNTNVINVPYLLLILFSALQIAFLFTIAFRGHIHIKTCYWIAAGVVGMLCIPLKSAIL